MAGWRNARTQEAWARLMQACEPLLREIAVRELRPIVTSRFEGVASHLLRANLGKLIPLFGSGEWDLEAVEQAIQASIAEARERAIPNTPSSACSRCGRPGISCRCSWRRPERD